MTEWKGKYEDWRIDWVTYGGPYIRYPAWPHPENGHDIARLSFADPTPFEKKKKRASLIAAAPDLYETLKAITDCYGVGSTPEQFCKNVRDFMLEGRAALAKARGEP